LPIEPSILIFLVEDEQLVRDLLHDALTAAGFAVEAARSGEQAMSMIQEAGASFRALVTDIDLGGKLTGWDVAKSARELHPSLAVVYMTGAAAHEWASKGVPKSVLVTKPFAPAQIVTAIAQLLNEQPALDA
jgi:DNA-binding NtrC family response regulator